MESVITLLSAPQDLPCSHDSVTAIVGDSPTDQLESAACRHKVGPEQAPTGAKDGSAAQLTPSVGSALGPDWSADLTIRGSREDQVNKPMCIVITNMLCVRRVALSECSRGVHVQGDHYSHQRTSRSCKLQARAVSHCITVVGSRGYGYIFSVC